MACVRLTRMGLRQRTVGTLKQLDHAAGRRRGRRRVLVDARTPMHLAVLRPVWRRLADDDRIALAFTAEEHERVREALRDDGMAGAFVSRRRAAWTRVDLAMTADIWNHTPLRRCRRAITFFHGVAGKYDLDHPARIAAADVARYDRIAFINRDRMARYISAGAIRPDQAVLVGFPKIDALVNGAWPPHEVRLSLGLPPRAATVLYAPTFSAASSLHAAGEAIVAALLDRGYSVIVKLHDRSAYANAHTGGIDWRTRLARFQAHRRFALARGDDASRLLAAADLLVTDHSTVGFEFALLDRPIVVFDAPGLKEAARIDPDKWNLLRSMADVVRTPAELCRMVERALARPERLRDRRRAAWDLFAHPGCATAHALAAVYELIELAPPAWVTVQVEDATWGAVPAGPGRLKPAPTSVMRPAPTSGMRPAPTSGMRPAPTSGLRPAPTSGLRPAPTSGLRPAPTSGLRPAPTSGMRPAPTSGMRPAPASGMRQAPASGLNPAPASGTSRLTSARAGRARKDRVA